MLLTLLTVAAVLGLIAGTITACYGSLLYSDYGRWKLMAGGLAGLALSGGLLAATQIVSSHLDAKALAAVPAQARAAVSRIDPDECSRGEIRRISRDVRLLLAGQDGVLLVGACPFLQEELVTGPSPWAGSVKAQVREFARAVCDQGKDGSRPWKVSQTVTLGEQGRLLRITCA